MKVELDKEDLICLVMGTSPDYALMEHWLVKPYGKYKGGFLEDWKWSRYELEKLTEELLWDIYQKCKESWEK